MTRKFLARENGIPVQVDESEFPTKVSQLENDSGYTTKGEVAAGYLPLSGGQMTGTINGVPGGGIRVEGTGTDLIAARSRNTDTGHDIWFGVGVSGSNRGIYDENTKSWLIYRDANNWTHFDGGIHVDGTAQDGFSIRTGAGIYCNGWIFGTNIKTTSDRRLKTDIEEIHPDLSSLHAYSYRFKSDGSPAYGLIAQEVREVLPDAVSETGEGEDKHLALDYNAVTAALVDEVNRLKLRVAALEGSKK